MGRAASPSRRDRRQTPPRVLRRGSRPRPRARPLTVGDLYIDYSKHRDHPAKRCRCWSIWPRPRTSSGGATRCSPVSTSTPRRTARCCTPRCDCPGRQTARRRQDVVADVHAGARRDGRLHRPAAQRRLDRGHRQADQTVVNIGIGGSDLGPVMVYQALRGTTPTRASRPGSSPTSTRPTWSAKLDGLDPATTLSSSRPRRFHPGDLTNATAARRWLTDALGDAVSKAFRRGVDQPPKLVDAFGIDTDNMFGFWDWVGGRYSVDSAIGLSVMAVIGREAFADFLSGFHIVDRHFATAPWRRTRRRCWADRPVVLRISSAPRPVRCCRIPTTCPVRGVSAAADDGVQRQVGARRRHPVTTSTGEIFWGEPGTNGQHAFYQLLHQGPGWCPPTSSASANRPTISRPPTATAACTTC